MKQEIILALEGRHCLYAVLSRLFFEVPDETLFAALRNGAMRSSCVMLDDAMREGVGDASRAWDRFARAAEDVRMEAAVREFTRLFVGPGKLPVPPWESVFATGERLLFQRSTLEVREAFRREGVVAQGAPHVAEDSLATELGFMAVLAERSRHAAEQDDAEELQRILRVQAEFLEIHLLRWIGQFAEQMAHLSQVEGSEAVSDLYPAAARLAYRACWEDVSLLSELSAACSAAW